MAEDIKAPFGPSGVLPVLPHVSSLGQGPPRRQNRPHQEEQGHKEEKKKSAAQAPKDSKRGRYIDVKV